MGASLVTPPESGTPPSSAGDTGTATVVVLADDFRARLVLRGLLLAHRVHLEGEAETPAKAFDLVRQVHPTHFLVDLGSGDKAVFQLISEARAIAPSMKIVLIRSAAHGYSAPPDPAQRPDALLREPFTILEFSQALYSGGLERLERRSVENGSHS